MHPKCTPRHTTGAFSVYQGASIMISRSPMAPQFFSIASQRLPKADHRRLQRVPRRFNHAIKSPMAPQAIPIASPRRPNPYHRRLQRVARRFNHAIYTPHGAPSCFKLLQTCFKLIQIALILFKDASNIKEMQQYASNMLPNSSNFSNWIPTLVQLIPTYALSVSPRGQVPPPYLHGGGYPFTW